MYRLFSIFVGQIYAMVLCLGEQTEIFYINIIYLLLSDLWFMVVDIHEPLLWAPTINKRFLYRWRIDSSNHNYFNILSLDNFFCHKRNGSVAHESNHLMWRGRLYHLYSMLTIQLSQKLEAKFFSYFFTRQKHFFSVAETNLFHYIMDINKSMEKHKTNSFS